MNRDETEVLNLLATAPLLSRRRLLALAGLGSVGLLIAGCAPGSEADYTVEMVEDYTFYPSSLTIPVNALVAWHNQGVRVHTVTFDPEQMKVLANTDVPQGARHWDSGDLYDGQTWRYRFDTPGDYVYFCRYHVDQGMIGLITVTA